MAEDHHNANIPPTIQPLKGHVVPMPTVQEISPSFEFGDAYTVEIIQRCAAQVSKLLDKTFPKDPSRPFNHLRRFVKEGFLPEQVRGAIETEKENWRRQESSDAGLGPDADANATAAPDVPTIFVLIPPPLPELAHLRALLAPFVPPHHRRLNAPAHDGSKLDQSTDNNTPETPNPASESVPEARAEAEAESFPIHRITIPLQPPLNQQQADQWTSTCWPTNFNAAFPRGIIAPPVKILSATRTNIAPKAGYYLGLASKVAQETKQLGRGRGIGVVVVDPALALASLDEDDEGDNGVVAVAGDARYCAPGIVGRDADGDGQNNADCEGGPEFHPIMRVVEMVASSRRAAKHALSIATTTAPVAHTPSLTPFESHYLYRPHTSSIPATVPSAIPSAPTEEGIATRILPRSAGGYLCTDLDIYITHEPCLSCCMGMLLSRFRAITFPRRGRLGSGGLASSGSFSAVAAAIEGEEPERGQVDGNDGEGRSVEEEEEEARGVYYGLHWRKELNWRAMCFEFVADADDVDDDMHVDGVEDRGDYYA